MVFASITFLWIFLPAVLIIYYLLWPLKKQKMQNFLLLFASLVFYSFGEPRLVVLLLVCVLVNYLGGLVIAGSEPVPGADPGTGSAAGSGSPFVRKAALALSVLISLGLLGYFKYCNFFLDALNRLTGAELSFRRVALPIGISFYTFQALSYTIDLYRGRCRVQRSFWRLLLYISFFPQLIAGPIVRYRDIAEQIDRRDFDPAMLTDGIGRFIAGLGKKVLLANVFAQRADLIFGMADTERGAALAWLGVLMYTLQIYFDFSGYSDMAIGMGKMFGFRFLENFDMPYTSRSLTEFWRRWHISLSSWFREYLYIPLGGNRMGTARTCVNLLIVFFVTGLWHGAGWTFILWGLCHGVFVILERLASSGRDPRETAGKRLLGQLYAVTSAALLWVLFRADSIQAACLYYRSLFSGALAPYSVMEVLGRGGLCATLVGIAMSVLISGERQRQIRQNPVFQMTVLPLVLLFCLVYLAAGSYNPFIYFRF